MKFTTSALLSLATTYAFANPLPQESSNLDLTDSQIAYVESLEIPDCFNTCMETAFAGDSTNPEEQPLPLCAIEDQEEVHGPEDTVNAYKCIYSDRISMSKLVSCIMGTCDSDALEDTLEAIYAQSWYLANKEISFPPPPQFLEELCLEAPEDVTIPETLKDLEEGLGYEYAADWPSPSVTTWIPPNFTGKPEDYVDNREPLTCEAAKDTAGSGSGSSSPTPTDSASGGSKPTQAGGAAGNGTNTGEEDDKGAAVGLYLPGMGMLMTVVGGVFVGGLGLWL